MLEGHPAIDLNRERKRRLRGTNESEEGPDLISLMLSMSNLAMCLLELTTAISFLASNNERVALPEIKATFIKASEPIIFLSTVMMVTVLVNLWTTSKRNESTGKRNIFLSVHHQPQPLLPFNKMAAAASLSNMEAASDFDWLDSPTNLTIIYTHILMAVVAFISLVYCSFIMAATFEEPLRLAYAQPNALLAPHLHKLQVSYQCCGYLEKNTFLGLLNELNLLFEVDPNNLCSKKVGPCKAIYLAEVERRRMLIVAVLSMSGLCLISTAAYGEAIINRKYLAAVPRKIINLVVATS